MKITQVTIYHVHKRPTTGQRPILVRVDTDEGIYGVGEVGLAYGVGGAAGAAMVKELAARIIGKDPFQIERIWEDFFKHTFWGQGGGTVVFSGISAIDIALWDIKGKALGVPVYELLGGKTRDKVRVYASVMHITEDKNELAAQYQQLQQMGFTAAKIFCNGPTSSPDGKGEFFSSRIEREGACLPGSGRP